MTRYSEYDYERAAGYMDGEEIELTAAQRALVEELTADAAVVGEALDAPPPAGTMHRVHGRLAGAGRQRRRGLWVRVTAGASAAAAVAAAVVLGLALRGGPDDPSGPALVLTTEEYLEHFEAETDTLDASLELLGEETADLEMDLATRPELPLGAAIEGISSDIDELMLPAETTGQMEDWEESL
jgi:hypothetical protein